MKDKDKVIVDTSAWIEYFNKGKSELANRVRKIIEEDLLMLIGPVFAELLQGAKNEKEYEQLKNNLDELYFVQTDKEDWGEAGNLSFKLKKNGYTLPLTDYLIASSR